MTAQSSSVRHHVVAIISSLSPTSTSWKLTALHDVPRGELLSDNLYLKKKKQQKKKNSVCLHCHYQQMSEQVVNKRKVENVTNGRAQQRDSTEP